MESIWENIKRHEGEVFYTVSGLEFTYQVVGEKLIHTRSKVAIPKSAFEKADVLNPQKPSDLHNDVVGPSYIYAIISDSRIRCVVM